MEYANWSVARSLYNIFYGNSSCPQSSVQSTGSSSGLETKLIVIHTFVLFNCISGEMESGLHTSITSAGNGRWFNPSLNLHDSCYFESASHDLDRCTALHSPAVTTSFLFFLVTDDLLIPCWFLLSRECHSSLNTPRLQGRSLFLNGVVRLQACQGEGRARFIHCLRAVVTRCPRGQPKPRSLVVTRNFPMACEFRIDRADNAIKLRPFLDGRSIVELEWRFFEFIGW